MITALELTNFKGIAERQRVEFAPLTLLFGANSAGKSTILQALLYLHEVIERGTAAVDRTELGGASVELGGYERMVHGHDFALDIVLRAEFTTPGGLEQFGRDADDFPFPDLDDEIEAAWLELTIHHVVSGDEGAIVGRVAVGVEGTAEPLVWTEIGSTLREGDPLYARVNLGHPLLVEGAAAVTDAWEEIAMPEAERNRSLAARGGGVGTGDGYGAALADGSGFGDGRALPVFVFSRSRYSALPGPSEPLRVIPFGDDTPEKSAAAEQVRDLLEMVLVGSTARLVASLRDMLYVGPLRAVPSRGTLYEHAGRMTSWANGLAAWEALLTDPLPLLGRTNEWLQRLGVGCQVVLQELTDRDSWRDDMDSGYVDKTVLRLLLQTGSRETPVPVPVPVATASSANRAARPSQGPSLPPSWDGKVWKAGSHVLPSEVGAGVSQIIPVIVAALQGRAGLTMIEQPEIHVHPAVQVGLGDLFIEAVTREGGRRMMLVETHSEHLILRLLRRIRETADGELPEGAPPFTPDRLSVLYVESHAEGTMIRRLRVDEKGEFIDRWPRGFFAERAEELF